MASLRQRTQRASTAVRSQPAPEPGDVASISTLAPALAPPLAREDLASLAREDLPSLAADPVVPERLEDLDLATVLHALSDPVRLLIVSQLADGDEHTCGSLDVPVAKSTSSHHFRVLREAGVLAQRLDGKCRYNRLRAAELEQRFPGLLEAVLQARP